MNLKRVWTTTIFDCLLMAMDHMLLLTFWARSN
jgi:hypothetical protein